jgi:polar amino acid transport system substrate-binding protein
MVIERKIMKRFPIWTLIILLIGLLTLSACKPTEIQQPFASYTVVIDATIPYFSFVDETSGDFAGYEIDLMEEIARRAGFTVSYENMAWSDFVDDLASCRNDHIYLASLSPRVYPEGEEVCYEVWYVGTNSMDFLYSYCGTKQNPLVFSDPYFQGGVVITVRAGDSTISDASNLEGKKISMLIGTVDDALWKPLGAEVSRFDDPDLMFQLLLDGDVDAIIGDLTDALKYAGNSDGKLSIVEQPLSLSERDYAMGVCTPGSHDLQDKINAALAEMDGDGTLSAMQDKWFMFQ